MADKVDGSIELNGLLMAIQHELVAHREVLAFTLASLEGAGHARVDIAAALKGLDLAPPVQARVDALASGLLSSAQLSPASSGLHLIDGGKDDLSSDNDDAA